MRGGVYSVGLVGILEEKRSMTRERREWLMGMLQLQHWIA